MDGASRKGKEGFLSFLQDTGDIQMDFMKFHPSHGSKNESSLAKRKYSHEMRQKATIREKNRIRAIGREFNKLAKLLPRSPTEKRSHQKILHDTVAYVRTLEVELDMVDEQTLLESWSLDGLQGESEIDKEEEITMEDDDHFYEMNFEGEDGDTSSQSSYDTKNVDNDVNFQEISRKAPKEQKIENSLRYSSMVGFGQRHWRYQEPMHLSFESQGSLNFAEHRSLNAMEQRLESLNETNESQKNYSHQRKGKHICTGYNMNKSFFSPQIGLPSNEWLRKQKAELASNNNNNMIPAECEGGKISENEQREIKTKILSPDSISNERGIEDTFDKNEQKSFEPDVFHSQSHDDISNGLSFDKVVTGLRFKL
eukprot:Seg555.3 transcript_id=Seg555.3/GoldUCD/mRNA.D3Y31 product="hypothetical protein" protein_id=Seg555.3/GoldUCD/D3Y31